MSPERERRSLLRADDDRAVLAQLQPDFPDVTISKIRFLEAEGLVTPSRTGSGYRTFSGEDLERLRYILTAQRDRFWPLKVIRDALDALDRGLKPAGPRRRRRGRPYPPADVDPALPTAGDLTRASSLRLTAAEVREAAGLDATTFNELTTFGLLRPDPAGTTASRPWPSPARPGAGGVRVEPPPPAAFRTAADREIGLVQQVTSPMRGRGTAGGRRGGGPTPELLALCIALPLRRSGRAPTDGAAE